MKYSKISPYFKSLVSVFYLLSFDLSPYSHTESELRHHISLLAVDFLINIKVSNSLLLAHLISFRLGGLNTRVASKAFIPHDGGFWVGNCFKKKKKPTSGPFSAVQPWKSPNPINGFSEKKVDVTFTNARDFVITLCDIYILTCSPSRR